MSSPAQPQASPPAPRQRRRLRRTRRIAAFLSVCLIVYLALAYLLAPTLWRHYDHQAALAGKPMTTTTAFGAAGDALNVGLEGSKDDVLCALQAAGWRPADPVTLRSSLHIADSVLLRRAYMTAPVSPLFYDGRIQDFAFEKPSGVSPSTRHHVRFWQALESGDDGLPLWLGAATFDRSVGVSRYTGQVTHHIAPDVDAERDLISADLAAAGMVQSAYWVSGVGPTLLAHNGGGDPYFTDGEIAVSRLSLGCQLQSIAPPTLAAPPAIAAKNRLFGWAEALWREL